MATSSTNLKGDNRNRNIQWLCIFCKSSNCISVQCCAGCNSNNAVLLDNINFQTPLLDNIEPTTRVGGASDHEVDTHSEGLPIISATRNNIQIQPVVHQESVNLQPEENWSCRFCTYSNRAQAVHCEMCENPKPFSNVSPIKNQRISNLVRPAKFIIPTAAKRGCSCTKAIFPVKRPRLHRKCKASTNCFENEPEIEIGSGEPSTASSTDPALIVKNDLEEDDHISKTIIKTEPGSDNVSVPDHQNSSEVHGTINCEISTILVVENETIDNPSALPLGQEQKSTHETSEKSVDNTEVVAIKEEPADLIFENTNCTTKSAEQAVRKTKYLKPDLSLQKLKNYLELERYYNIDLVTCLDHFYCSICLCDYRPGEGYVLKDCLHTFCRECLVQAVDCSIEAEVKCPYSNEVYQCPSKLQDREIKSLVSAEVYEKHLSRSVNVAELNMKNAYHCKTPDCVGWWILDENANGACICPTCWYTNCLDCKAIHTNLTCEEYKIIANGTDDASLKHLEKLLMNKKMMLCPKCKACIVKEEGCDAITCSVCQLAICWATKGSRWGPKGQGDISGGCRCNVNGMKCHPDCRNCH